MEWVWGFGGYKLSDGTVVKVQRTNVVNGGHAYALVRDPSNDYTYKRYGRTHKHWGWKKGPLGTLSQVRREIEAGTAQWRNPVSLQWVAPKVRQIP